MIKVPPNSFLSFLLFMGLANAETSKLTRFECDYTSKKRIYVVQPDGSKKLMHEKNKFIFFVEKIEDNRHATIWTEEDTYMAFWPQKADSSLSLLSDNLSADVNSTEITAKGDGDGEESNTLELSRYPATSKDWEGTFYFESNSPDEEGVYETWKTDVVCTTKESNSVKAKAEVQTYTQRAE